MKRPEPPQDFEKTIQRVNMMTLVNPTSTLALQLLILIRIPFLLKLKTQKAAQKKPASAPLDIALHERNKEVAHNLASEMPLNNYTKHP